MTDQTAQDGDGEDVASEEPEGAAEKPKRGRRMILAGGGALLLLGGAGLAGAWSLGLLSGAETETPPAFYELPEMTVNLSTVDERPQYLRIRATLELADRSDARAVEAVLPRVLDAFQVYLRELRATDLEGSAGLFRLKEELVRRVNMATHPTEIEGVVFEEIVIQ